uniref:Uncharacterized protein n=1 Tax=Hippocampus comes TaxID=109280 RepID=A0A3Q2Z920_HIPCM
MLCVCKNGVCVNNIPGYNCYCSSGFVYSVALLECVDLDECEQESCEGGSCVNTLGSYYCSCSPPLVLDDTQRKCNLSVCWQTVSAELMCQSPLLGAQVTFSDCCCLYGQGWGMESSATHSHRFMPYLGGKNKMCLWNVEESNVWPTCGVRPICVCFAGRYDAYAGLSAADDCGIVDGCRNGTCIRLDEGYTCDCYHGYRLDATTMTCIDVNECLGGVDVDFPCINSRCVNTDGSFRCVCRRGYVMSRRLNHCVPA